MNRSSRCLIDFSRIGMAAVVAAAAVLLASSTSSGQRAGKPKKVGGYVIDFYGIKSNAQRVCIIADRSGSMDAGLKYYDYKAKQVKYGQKSSMGHLRAELIKVVKAVTKKRHGKFHIILYSTNATAQPVKGWAGPAAVPKVVDWIKQTNPDGDTNPLPAFDLAFKLKPLPDVIYFMTDGIITTENFGARLGKKWVKHNMGRKKRIPIHTIQVAVPGQDRASMLMSRWHRKIKSGKVKALPAAIRGAIENTKRIHESKLRNPVAKKQMEDEIEAQIYLMKLIADQTDGKTNTIKTQK